MINKKDEKTMANILDLIEIPYMNEIRGNIDLPDNIDGTVIEWSSSHPDIVCPVFKDNKKPGVVTRPEKDTKVTLTVRVKNSSDADVKAFVVKVLKKPDAIKEADYQGYLFGHFIGEEDENSEQIYLAVSENGLNFKDMNGKKPVIVSQIGEKGLRDPYICRSAEGDRFFMIATDLSIYHRGGWVLNEQGYYDPSTTGSQYLVFSESTDLVDWSEPRLIDVAPKNAGMAWAPEMVYSEETGDYVIFFSSSIMDPETKYKSKPNAIYYVTTRDFVHFTDTKIFIDNQRDGAADGKPREIIDTTILKIGEYYYAASKDGDNEEKNGGIRIHKNKNLFNPDGWEKVLDLDELGIDISKTKLTALDNSMLEGPELFKYNRKDWADKNVPEYGLIADQFMLGTGYLPFKTTDIEDKDNSNNSWKMLDKKQYSFDKLKKRHGTILNITKNELDYIKAKLG